ncbi:MAG: RNA pseudouridine synthase [Rhodospirillaceae bacterium]|nr:MAG: RNA pseudouridine synthase [Rhodospirillaceae bacterium]
MSGVQTITLGPKSEEQRLDRWFKDKYPGLTFGRLQKLLRKGEVRVNGKRVKDAKVTIKPGDTIRIPPLDKEKTQGKPKIDNDRISAEDVQMIQACVMHKDDHIIILNKPAGLAVQGGSNTTRHVDGMLEALKFDTGERPRLVHRIDKDTSGILVLARNQKTARFLTNAFRSKDIRKAYWAIVVGIPEREEGRLELPLSKRGSIGHERMVVDEFEGKRAITEFKIIDKVGRRAAWVEMEPITGRTHQLRVHMLSIDTPILGDGKYGGTEAFLSGAEIAKQVHLHARAVRFPHPGGGDFEITAPLPQHMKETWAYLGFDENQAPEPFEDDL